MYGPAFKGGRPIRTIRHRIHGITTQGEELEITKVHSGLGFWALNELYVEPMWAGDASAAQRLAERINRSLEKPVIAFRLQKEILTLSKTGILKEDEPVMTYRVVE
jgi:hypothetical protein